MESANIAEGETYDFAFAKNQLDCTQEELLEALDRAVYPKDCNWRSKRKDIPEGTVYLINPRIDRIIDPTMVCTSIFISSATGKCYANAPDDIHKLIKCHRLSKKLGIETPTFNNPNEQVETLEDASLLMEWLRDQLANLLDETNISSLQGGSIRFELSNRSGNSIHASREVRMLLEHIKLSATREKLRYRTQAALTQPTEPDTPEEVELLAFFDTPLFDIDGVSSQASNALRRNGINTIGDALSKPRGELCVIYSVGPNSLKAFHAHVLEKSEIDWHSVQPYQRRLIQRHLNGKR